MKANKLIVFAVNCLLFSYAHAACRPDGIGGSYCDGNGTNGSSYTSSYSSGSYNPGSYNYQGSSGSGQNGFFASLRSWLTGYGGFRNSNGTISSPDGYGNYRNSDGSLCQPDGFGGYRCH